MATGDADRWNARHAKPDVDVAPATPSALVPPPGDPLMEAILASVVTGLPEHGVALDVACGLGAQSVWAAAAGLRVTALDVSPVAIDATRRLAAAHGVADRVEAIVCDLDDGLPGRVPDAIDLVICQRFRLPALYDELFDVLRPATSQAHGGVGVITVLSDVGAADPGPYHAPSGELARAVGRRDDLDLVRAIEARGEASVVVRRR